MSDSSYNFWLGVGIAALVVGIVRMVDWVFLVRVAP